MAPENSLCIGGEVHHVSSANIAAIGEAVSEPAARRDTGIPKEESLAGNHSASSGRIQWLIQSEGRCTLWLRTFPVVVDCFGNVKAGRGGSTSITPPSPA